MDEIMLTSQQCVWWLTLTQRQFEAVMKKLSTGKFVLMWDRETCEYNLVKVE